jgi:exonuclease III
MTDTLHIVSFNVAGWKTTHSKIVSYFGTLENWLNALKIDILCLQEVKINKKDIDKTVGADLQNYETFWCTPSVNSTLSDKEKKLKQEKHVQVKNGINGVTSIVRKGLVVKANSRVLDDEDFNDEGRCLLTDHGSFVVFNVYGKLPIIIIANINN